MGEFRVPFQAADSEFVEKRSRFISHLLPVESEEDARAFIAQIKKQYYDARHNCWCYLIGENVVRYSDDGEPQGTAGQPMLNVFQRENVTNVVCVVTRYFGGILLGAGGLTRAYSKGGAGRSVRRRVRGDGAVGRGGHPVLLCAVRAGAAGGRRAGRHSGRHPVRCGHPSDGVTAGGESGDLTRTAHRVVRRRRPARGAVGGVPPGAAAGALSIYAGMLGEILVF